MKRRTQLSALGLGAFSLFLGLGCGGSALPAPSNLMVSPLGAGIHLTWMRNSMDESEFQIERKTDSTAYSKLTSVPFGTTVYHDEPVTSGTMYYYRVRAAAGERLSDYSNEASMKAP